MALVWEVEIAAEIAAKEPDPVRVEVDAAGRFRLVVSGTPPRSVTRFDVEGDAWQVVSWHAGDAPGSQTISIDPDAVTRVTVLVRRAFRLRGVVTNAAGAPLSGVAIRYGTLQRSGTAVHWAMQSVETGADGRFDVGPFPEDPRAGFEDVGKSADPAAWTEVTFQAEGHASVPLAPSSVPPADRDRLVIRLDAGHTLEGTAYDPAGRTVPDAVVAVEYGSRWNLRRAARTDAQGRFKLERLTPGPAVLMARAFAQDLRLRRELTLSADDRDLRLVLESILLSKPPVTTEVLGLRLAEVDDEIRAAYDLPQGVDVVVLDPGANPESLGIGRLEKGYGIWMVGPDAVANVGEAIDRLLDRTPSEGSHENRRRVVYTFWNEEGPGTNTQHVTVTAEQEAALKALRDRLPR